MRVGRQLFLIVLVAGQILALALINTVHGAQIAQLYVDPPLSAAIVGENVSITLNVANVLDLYAWQIALSFNPAVLEVVNVAIGDFLATQPQGTFSPPHVINNTVGWVGIGETTLGRYPGVDGSGLLATVTFRTKADGESFLNITDPIPVDPLHNATSLLLDSTYPDSKEIPFTTKDGSFIIGSVPVASFTYSPLFPEADVAVTFNASDSYDLDGTIIKYEWDFGDESNGTGIIVQHTFAEGGTYSVTLTVTDDSLTGLQGTLTKDVSIKFAVDIAVTGVTISPTTVRTGEIVSINVAVKNEGLNVVTFDVAIHYDGDLVGTLTFSNLGVDATQTLTYEWDTSHVDPDTYRIEAVAETLEGEIDTADNTYTGGTVSIEASAGGFPIEYLVIGVVVVVVVVGAAFLYMRRKSSTSA